MTILEILLSIVIARYGGALTDDYQGSTKVIGWLFVLLGVGLAVFAGTKAHAVPVVKSPYVIQRQWTPAPLNDAGYARATSDCAPAMPTSRAAIKGEVFKMVLNGWVYTYDNRNAHSVWPINSIGVPGTALYLYMDCLEGVRQL